MRLHKLNSTLYIPYATSLLSRIFHNVDSVAIFGGYIRDHILNSLYYKYLTAHDLDVVVQNTHQLDNYIILKNRFEGNTIFVHNIRIDFWELKDTFSIKKKNTSISIETLPETTVFNCNSVVYDIRSCRLYESGFFKSLEMKTIDFNDISYLYEFKEMQAIRAYYLSKKLKFKLSTDIIDFVYTTMLHSSYSIILQKLRFSKYSKYSLILEIYKNLFTSKKYNKSYCERYIKNKFFNTDSVLD